MLPVFLHRCFSIIVVLPILGNFAIIVATFLFSNAVFFIVGWVFFANECRKCCLSNFQVFIDVVVFSLDADDHALCVRQFLTAGGVVFVHPR